MSIKIMSWRDSFSPDTVQRRGSLVVLGQPALLLSVPLEAAYIVLLSGLLSLQEPLCYVGSTLDQACEQYLVDRRMLEALFEQGDNQLVKQLSKPLLWWYSVL